MRRPSPGNIPKTSVGWQIKHCAGKSSNFFFPHHCVGFLFFALHPPLSRPPALPHHNSSQHHLSHHNITCHITAPLITPSHHNSSQLITAPLITPHSSQHIITQLHCHSSLITAQLIITQLHSTTHHTTCGSTTHHHTAALHTQLHCTTHHTTCDSTTHHHTAGFRVAGAVHRAFCRSCCARGRRWAAAGCRPPPSKEDPFPPFGRRPPPYH